MHYFLKFHDSNAWSKGSNGAVFFWLKGTELIGRLSSNSVKCNLEKNKNSVLVVMFVSFLLLWSCEWASRDKKYKQKPFSCSM